MLSRDMLEILKPLDDKGRPYHRRLLFLRRLREDIERAPLGQRISGLIVEMLLRSGIPKSPRASLDKLFLHLVAHRCYPPALAMAFAESDPGRKKGLMKLLLAQGGCSRRLFQDAEEEANRLNDLYPEVFPVTIGKAQRERATDSIERFMSDIETNPRRCSWNRALELISITGEGHARFIRAMEAVGLNAAPIRVVYENSREVLESTHDRVKVVEWASRLGRSIQQQVLPGLSTPRGMRARILNGERVPGYSKWFTLQPECEQIKVIEEWAELGAPFPESIALSPAALIQRELLGILQADDETTITGRFWSMVRQSLSHIREYLEHKVSFVEFVQEKREPGRFIRRWLQEHRAAYMDHLPKLSSSLMAEGHLEEISDPVWLADILSGNCPGVRSSLPPDQAREYLFRRLANSNPGALFHALTSCLEAELLILSTEETSDLLTDLTSIEAWLLDMQDSCETMSRQLGDFLREKSWEDLAQAMCRHPRPPVAVVESVVRKALLDMDAPLAARFLPLLEKERGKIWSQALSILKREPIPAKLFFSSGAVASGELAEFWFGMALQALVAEPTPLIRPTASDWLAWRPQDIALQAFRDFILLHAGYFSPERFKSVAGSFLARTVAFHAGWETTTFAGEEHAVIDDTDWGDKLASLVMEGETGIFRAASEGKWREVEVKLFPKITRGLPGSAGFVVRSGSEPEKALLEAGPWKESAMFRSEAMRRIAPRLDEDHPNWASLLALVSPDPWLAFELLIGCRKSRPELRSVIAKLCDQEGFEKKLLPLLPAIIDYTTRTGDSTVVPMLAEAIPWFHLQGQTAFPATYEEREQLRGVLARVNRWLDQAGPDDTFIRGVRHPETWTFQATRLFTRAVAQALRENGRLLAWVRETLFKYATDEVFRKGASRSKTGSKLLGLGERAEAGRILFLQEPASRKVILYRLYPLSCHDEYEKDLSQGAKELLKEPIIDWKLEELTLP